MYLQVGEFGVYKNREKSSNLTSTCCTVPNG